MQIKIDPRDFKGDVRRWTKKIQNGAIDAANLTVAGLAAELRAATPVLTGKTRRAVGFRATRDINEPARAGFYQRKGNTAFVANLLEYGTGPRFVKRHRARGRLVLMRTPRYVGRGPVRPILAPALAQARAIAEEAISRVFTPGEIRSIRAGDSE